MKTLELAAELANDPLGRGYAGMTDQEAADDLNTLYRYFYVDTVAGYAIFNATDDEEYAALTAEQQASWDRLCAIEQIDVTNGVAKAREAELFGSGTVTRTNLLDLKRTLITRAQELDILEYADEITADHVAQARA